MKLRLILLIFTAICLAGMLAIPSAGGRTSAQATPDWQGQIAYLGSDGNIWVQSSEEALPFQLTSDADEDLRYYAPQFSPGGDLLAYCRNDNAGAGGSDLYLVRTGAWQPIFLVADVYCQAYPQRGFDWSPDGSSIAYSRSFEYNPQPDGRQWSVFHGIWSVDIVSGEAEELVPPPGTNPLVYPLWSPDGRWIRMYELVFQEGLGVLRTWNQESGALYNWLGLGGDLFPGFSDWSPDSSRLVFDQVTYVGYPGAGLFTSVPDVSGLQQIFVDPGRGVVQPLWSPDGATLAFQLLIYYRNEQTSLMFSAPDGGDLREAFTNQASMVLLDWSPQGDQLLLVTDDGGQAGLYIYDLPSKGAITIALPSGWQADWSVLPEDTGFETSGKSVEIEGFTASGGSLLVYLAENYQLWLFDPSNGSQAALSPPLSAAKFWVSPSGERLIYADRLLKLEFQPGGTVSVQQSTLPNIPDGDEITWAPDENRFSYQDSTGRIWLVDSGGSFVEIPGASGLPEWSFDGRFINYCTEGSKLWVVGGGISLREVASPVDCDVEWSSSLPILAYTLQDGAGADSDQVYVYHAELGKSSLALDSTSLVGWSPDGKVLAMKRPAKGGSGDFTYFALDPTEQKLLEVGLHNSGSPGLQGWGDTSQDYILGPYQLSSGLTGSDRVADVIYDVSPASDVLLIGSGEGTKQDLSCLDMQAGQPTDLLSASLSRIPAARRPGIWAGLSPDGAWSSANFSDSGSISYLLTRCDRQRQATLEVTEDFQGDGFSTDSRWYFQQVPGEDRSGNLLLYNLDTLERGGMLVLSGAPVVWLGPPAATGEGDYVIGGVVLDQEGNPEAAVNILVDEQPAATSDEEGKFEISGLSAGEHTIKALKGELVFAPQTHEVDIPDEAGDLLFTVQPAQTNSQQPIASAQMPTQTVLTAQTGVGEGSRKSAAGEVGGNSSLIDNLWVLVIGTVLLISLLFILFVRIVKRRRARSQAEPAGDSPQPASKSSVEQPSGKLKQGVDQVKAGQIAEGRLEIEEVLRDDPQNSVAWLWLGMAAAKLKDWQGAESSFEQARSLGNPKADEALKWLSELRTKG